MSRDRTFRRAGIAARYSKSRLCSPLHNAGVRRSATLRSNGLARMSGGDRLAVCLNCYAWPAVGYELGTIAPLSGHLQTFNITPDCICCVVQHDDLKLAVGVP